MYKTPLATAAERISSLINTEDLDPTEAAMVRVAQAYAAVVEQEAKAGPVYFQGRYLVSPSLERAFRELQYIRRNRPPEELTAVVFTRLGRLVSGNSI